MGAAVLMLAGCQSAARNRDPGRSSESAPPSSSEHKSVRASEGDGGHTIAVTVGDDVSVVLHSTYWRLAPITSSTVLQAKGPAASSSAKGCVPGQGCGTVTQTFRASAKGRAVITASRTTCGEALRCTGSLGSYSLTVVVG